MANDSWNEQAPDNMTAPCARFFRDYFNLWEYITFVPPLVKRASRDYEIVRLKFPTYYQLLFQMWLCRAVDGFLVYVSELLAFIFITVPDAMKARGKSENINLDIVLEYDTKEEIISGIADEIVNSLAYKGMMDIHKFLSEKLGFSLFPREDDLSRAIILNEIRNLIVHNRAVVNRIFLKKMPKGGYMEGDVIELLAESVFDDIEFLGSCVTDIDIRASEKFSLERPYTREDLPGVSDFSFIEDG